MKDVLISIRGTQKPNHTEPGADNSPVSVELVTDGRYEYSDQGSWFTYQESELTGMEGTQTTFRMEDDLVMLTRVGSVNAQMLFQAGRKHVFLYDTPYGAMTMGVDTHSILSTLGDRGGSLEVRYLMDLGNSMATRNRFEINIKI